MMLALQKGLSAVFHPSPPAINADRELSLTPTQPNEAHPSSECIAHSPALHPQQGPGGFRPNTFEGAAEGAGTHVWPHPHKVDTSSRASQPTISSTTRQQIQRSSDHQTYSSRHHQSLTCPSHMAHQVTHDYGLLLPGIGYGSANLMLQALL